MKILTQGNGLKGYHGTIGTPTAMFDSYGKPLFVGDVVISINQDDFASKSGYVGTTYGLNYVVEENPEIADWTGRHNQFVQGIYTYWNSERFLQNNFHLYFEEDSSSDYWEEFREKQNGWIVEKVKSYEKLVEGERLDFLYVQTVGDEL